MSLLRARGAACVAGAALMLATLTGCGQSEYCKAVEEREVTLNSLGEKKSNDAYLAYARAFRAVASVAPPNIREDWTKLADVTQGVVTAHTKAGIRMEEMSDDKKLAVLATQPDKQELLNNAYDAFNDTPAERKAVVKNVKDECEIALS